MKTARLGIAAALAFFPQPRRRTHIGKGRDFGELRIMTGDAEVSSQTENA
jgi:hypothetical protein